jgi:hypothetical protein
MDFELKFREASINWNQGKFDWKFLGTWNLMKLVQHFPCYTLLQEKIKVDQKSKFLSKVGFELISRWFKS